MSSWLHGTLDSWGYAGIVAMMVLENLFPPIPSEVVMPYAGYAAAQGDLRLWAVVLAGTVGSVLGALPLYYLGHWVGADRLRDWADRHGHWLMITPDEIDRASRWFEQHGRKTVFLARLVPGVRSLISIPAGMCRMKLAQFLLWTAAGTAIWAGLLAWGGSALGERYEEIGRYLGPATYVVLVGLAVTYVVYVWRRKRENARSEG